MKNTLKEKIEQGLKTCGTFLELGSATSAECLGLAGLDYVIIDGEHGPVESQFALDSIRAARLYHITPFARVPDCSRATIVKMLDVGAQGLIIPNISSVEEAESIVRYGKSAPLGERGVAKTVGSGFWFEEYASHGLPHYFELTNRETMLIPQCETLGCLEHLEEIVAMPGIDGIFVGPFDLSTAMGIPGDFGNPEFKATLRHIQTLCAAAKKPSFIFAASMESAREAFQMGYNSVTYGMDATVLVNAYKSAIREMMA